MSRDFCVLLASEARPWMCSRSTHSSLQISPRSLLLVLNSGHKIYSLAITRQRKGNIRQYLVDGMEINKDNHSHAVTNCA